MQDLLPGKRSWIEPAKFEEKRLRKDDKSPYLSPINSPDLGKLEVRQVSYILKFLQIMIFLKQSLL
jgi:hypothetical protein